jgi:hypothetical protein
LAPSTAGTIAQSKYLGLSFLIVEHFPKFMILVVNMEVLAALGTPGNTHVLQPEGCLDRWSIQGILIC